MKTLIAVLLCAAVPAFAQAPADAPIADEPGTSVRLGLGEPAPFAGRLLSPEENKRRGQSKADCVETIADAKANNVLLPKPAVAAILTVAVVSVLSVVTLGTALALKR